MRPAFLAMMTVCSGAIAQSDPQYLPYKMLNTASDPFRYYIDNRSATPAGINISNVQDATDKAWNTWNAVHCASPKGQSSGFTGTTVFDPPDPYDVFNVTPVWVVSASDPLHSRMFSTFVKGVTIPLAYAGVLVQCDIFLNGVGINWSVGASTPSGSVDLETVMLHEVGHCLGLDHWRPDFPALSVMTHTFLEGYQRRVLDPRDLEILCDRNPVQGGIGSPCLADGGCGSTVVNGLKCITQPLATGSARFCTVGCATGIGAECALPLYCEPASYFAPTFNGACLRAVDTVTRVGAPCSADNQCSSANGQCVRETFQPSGYKRWNQGYCSQNCGTARPVCPASSQCTNIGDPEPICLLTCRVGLADCRSGYSCAQTSGKGVCIPSCFQDVDCQDTTNYQCRTCDGLCVPRQNSTAQIGDVCEQDVQCGAGQLCSSFGFKPGKLCTLPCGSGCGTCPAGSACHPIPPNNALSCMRTCNGPGTCPGGTRCASLSTGRVCMPPCLDNVDCPLGQDCKSGECFNPGDYDGGCGAFCPTVDAGRPIVQPRRDAGAGGGGSGGCGCSTGLEGSAFLWVALFSLRRRRG